MLCGLCQKVAHNCASYTEGLSVSLCKADHTARQKTHMTAVNKVQGRRRGDAVRKCQSNQYWKLESLWNATAMQNARSH